MLHYRYQETSEAVDTHSRLRTPSLARSWGLQLQALPEQSSVVDNFDTVGDIFRTSESFISPFYLVAFFSGDGTSMETIPGSFHNLVCHSLMSTPMISEDVGCRGSSKPPSEALSYRMPGNFVDFIHHVLILLSRCSPCKCNSTCWGTPPTHVAPQPSRRYCT